MSLSRRDFLAAAGGLCAAPAVAIDRSNAPRAAAVKLGLAAYSFRKELDLKKPTMTLFDFIDLAAGLKVDGVELTQYYFADTSDAYVDKTQGRVRGEEPDRLRPADAKRYLPEG